MRNNRVDITLGILTGIVLYIGWVQFDMGKRIEILTTNLTTLTQEVIKP